MDKFAEQLEEWGLEVSGEALNALSVYAEYLAGYDEANVIGTRDRGRILHEHVLDCLSCFLFEPLSGAGKVIDIGSGGGLPGIPIRLLRPDLALTCVEATGKKARFLEKLTEAMALDGVGVVNDRAEALGKIPEYRGKYDVATARALASLSELVEYCVPFVKEGGHVIAMKARPSEEEIEAGSEAAELLGAELSEEIEVEFLPEISEKKRTLIIATKTSSTPDEYPRRIGVPKKSPLGGG